MTCRDFEKMMLDMDAEATRHLEACPACSSRKRAHDRISAMAASLKREPSAPGLRLRIRDALQKEIEQRPRRRWRKGLLMTCAAAAVLLMLTTPFILFDAVRTSTLIVEAPESLALMHELQRVEQRLGRLTDDFRQAITSDGRAEKRVAFRLKRIDKNLNRCRTLLENNPMNRAVSKALLDATRLKLDVIIEYLSK